MQLSLYLHLVRQYNELSQRKHLSYAPVVDKLTEDFTQSESENDEKEGMTAAQITAMRDREYNPLYRSYPLSRPTE